MTVTRKQAYRRIEINRIIMIIVGIASAAFGLKGFLIPNEFIDGGVTGISLLINAKTEIPLGLSIIVLNIPFLLINNPYLDDCS